MEALWNPHGRAFPDNRTATRGAGEQRALPGPTDRALRDLAGPTSGQPCVTDVGQDKRARALEGRELAFSALVRGKVAKKVQR